MLRCFAAIDSAVARRRLGDFSLVAEAGESEDFVRGRFTVAVVNGALLLPVRLGIFLNYPFCQMCQFFGLYRRAT